MKFKHGIDLINRIAKERERIKKAQIEFEKAEAQRMALNKQSVMNQKFEETKSRQMEIIECSRATARDYYQELIDLKKDLKENEWQTILEYLGFILAKIDYIEHVEECLNDEERVQNAVNYTMSVLRRKRVKLRQAQEKKDDDRAIILNAEIAFYEKDLQKHPIGILALAKDEDFPKLKRGINNGKK